MTEDGLMQIGEVAERTYLSLRTIRYYEEIGLVVPSARSQGGFRLYTGTDVRRLWFIRRLKPLELTLEQIRDLMAAVDACRGGEYPGGEAAARNTLAAYLSVARARRETLRDQLAGVEEFTEDLSDLLAEPSSAAAPTVRETGELKSDVTSGSPDPG
ncbi:DNA-binding transcriptional MerR regulator [Stackebrandtia albiflava]|uniref:DNA-binding transcriptional MerR regulator n=1 Tax=Stackebrandtia albiflava TaxID=406432 RepID=A0A562VDY2_9ACTN|nr:MerR family transcriptional regulator [Stackebrandtia albiflava]TWJ16083.1 DNA-binding transcriptional MerR regulator [Stackebrandtia albiflava]